MIRCQRWDVKSFIRYQVWGFLINWFSVILAEIGLHRPKTGPQDKVWSKRGLRGACLKFGQDGRLPLLG